MSTPDVVVGLTFGVLAVVIDVAALWLYEGPYTDFPEDDEEYELIRRRR